jgi:hypothetical protein
VRPPVQQGAVLGAFREGLPHEGVQVLQQVAVGDHAVEDVVLQDEQVVEFALGEEVPAGGDGVVQGTAGVRARIVPPGGLRRAAAD